jgi:MFS family permease
MPDPVLSQPEPTAPGPLNPLTVPFLGILAGLQLVDPSVANIALVKAARALEMQGPTLDLAASLSTLVQAATVLLMGFLADRFGRRRVLLVSLLLAVAGNLITEVVGFCWTRSGRFLVS